jgi:hypothetical protein
LGYSGQGEGVVIDALEDLHKKEWEKDINLDWNKI